MKRHHCRTGDVRGRIQDSVKRTLLPGWFDEAQTERNHIESGRKDCVLLRIAGPLRAMRKARTVLASIGLGENKKFLPDNFVLVWGSPGALSSAIDALAPVLLSWERQLDTGAPRAQTPNKTHMGSAARREAGARIDESCSVTKLTDAERDERRERIASQPCCTAGRKFF